MALLVVGSHALNKIKQTRQPRDMDLIGHYDEAVEFLKSRKCTSIYPIQSGKKLFGKSHESIYEIEIAWDGTTADELLSPYSLVGNYPGQLFYAELNELYTLKMSHRYLKNSPHFNKTRKDILLMREMGAEIPSQLWYEQRQRETYNYKLPNLNQPKDMFFQDQYKYDHDSLHQAVKITDKPAYQFFSEAGAEVKSSKKLWDACDTSIKWCAGVEEASVLALERSLVPFPGKKTEDEAFEFALIKVCTSITSGWFREFCWENYDYIMAVYRMFDRSLLELLEQGLAKGIVKENPNYVPAENR